MKYNRPKYKSKKRWNMAWVTKRNPKGLRGEYIKTKMVLGKISPRMLRHIRQSKRKAIVEDYIRMREDWLIETYGEDYQKGGYNRIGDHEKERIISVLAKVYSLSKEKIRSIIRNFNRL